MYQMLNANSTPPSTLVNISMVLRLSESVDLSDAAAYELIVQSLQIRDLLA